MECQEADWVGSENGSCVNPFHGLVSCFGILPKLDLENRFPGLNSVLYAQAKGKVVNPASFRPLFLLVEHLGGKLTAQLTTGDRYLISLC